MNKKEQRQAMYAAFGVALVLFAILIWWLLHDPTAVMKEGGDVIIELG